MSKGPSQPVFLDPRTVKVLSAQMKNFMEQPIDNLLLHVDEKDIRVWYFMIGGLQPDPSTGEEQLFTGEYIFKLTAPEDFPHKPPSFEFLTPNGVYAPGGPICISVGEWHADDDTAKKGSHGAYGWRASLGMKGFAMQVLNGLICYAGLESGIRIMETTAAVKRAEAAGSRSVNAKLHADIAGCFEDFIRANPSNKTVAAILKNRAPASSSSAAAAPAAAKAPTAAPTTAKVPTAAKAPTAAAAPANTKEPPTGVDTIDDLLASLMEND